MDRFKWSILALAQHADVQQALFPDFVPAGDELALNFEEALATIDRQGMAERQRSALDALDQKILSLSGQGNADFWLLPERLQHDDEWNAIRLLARAVAEAFSWEIETLPPAQGLYIETGSHPE